MRAYSVALPAAGSQPISLSSLLGQTDHTERRCDSLTLQNPVAQDTINFGTNGKQPGILVTGDTISLPIQDTRTVFVTGTEADLLIVICFP